MFLTFRQLRERLGIVIENKGAQGHETAGLQERLAGIADSYDALWGFAQKLARLPMRAGWAFVEPNDWDSICGEMDPKRELERVGKVDLAEAKRRAEAGFLGCCAGCILGKPLEINPTLEELQKAFEKIGEWPIRDYIPGRVKTEGGLRSLHPDWPETLRENIQWVAPDDDLNYTVLGMMILEKFGLKWGREELREIWGRNITPFNSWGPERTIVIKNAMDSWGPGDRDYDLWVDVLNPEDEKCGAQIRPDAYGYACAGRPMLAAELAWRDASWTHRRTGIYATMFQAAVLALAHVEKDRLKIFEKALQYVPQRSRFFKMMKDALGDVAAAGDWMDGYRRLHAKLKEYRHCLIYFETGTMMNTLRFAEDVGDGICKQVMQGNDTDSYGARAGSMLGIYFGPGHLEERWLKPFNDRLHTTVAMFHEQRLSEVTRRMGELPGIVERELAGKKS